MAETVKVEKFAANELTSLRDELTRSGIDLWQAGEVLSAFLAGRGYGVIPEQARDAVLRLEGLDARTSAFNRSWSGLH